MAVKSLTSKRRSQESSPTFQENLQETQVTRYSFTVAYWPALHSSSHALHLEIERVTTTIAPAKTNPVQIPATVTVLDRNTLLFEGITNPVYASPQPSIKQLSRIPFIYLKHTRQRFSYQINPNVDIFQIRISRREGCLSFRLLSSHPCIWSPRSGLWQKVSKRKVSHI